MEKSERVAIAKHVLSLIENETPYMGDESWEADIGRFVDQERFDLEKRKLFWERPQLIALSADVPNPGDYYATDIAGKPILIMRGKDGVARAFLNACRHRGVKLAEEGCGHGKGFVCPYHGWTFNTEGALISVPSRSAFDVEQLANRDLIALPTQVSSQIMMEAGAVKSVLFGKREACLTGMHKGYDEAIGHDAQAALRSNSAAMGV